MKRYFTGKFCINGHVSERHTNGRGCIICCSIRNRKYFSNNKDKKRQYDKQYHLDNIDEYLLRNKIRKKRLRKATPPWADMGAIKRIYREAHEKRMHVDHIIPLNGKNVSGLHVENNLQILPPMDNIRKGNRFDC